MTPEEALAIYHAGPDVVVKVLCDLSNQVELLQKQMAELQKEVQRLLRPACQKHSQQQQTSLV